MTKLQQPTTEAGSGIYPGKVVPTMQQDDMSEITDFTMQTQEVDRAMVDIPRQRIRSAIMKQNAQRPQSLMGSSTNHNNHSRFPEDTGGAAAAAAAATVLPRRNSNNSGSNAGGSSSSAKKNTAIAAAAPTNPRFLAKRRSSLSDAYKPSSEHSRQLFAESKLAAAASANNRHRRSDSLRNLYHGTDPVPESKNRSDGSHIRSTHTSSTAASSSASPFLHSRTSSQDADDNNSGAPPTGSIGGGSRSSKTSVKRSHAEEAKRGQRRSRSVDYGPRSTRINNTEEEGFFSSTEIRARNVVPNENASSSGRKSTSRKTNKQYDTTDDGKSFSSSSTTRDPATRPTRNDLIVGQNTEMSPKQEKRNDNKKKTPERRRSFEKKQDLMRGSVTEHKPVIVFDTEPLSPMMGGSEEASSSQKKQPLRHSFLRKSMDSSRSIMSDASSKYGGGGASVASSSALESLKTVMQHQKETIKLEKRRLREERAERKRAEEECAAMEKKYYQDIGDLQMEMQVKEKEIQCLQKELARKERTERKREEQKKEEELKKEEQRKEEERRKEEELKKEELEKKEQLERGEFSDLNEFDDDEDEKTMNLQKQIHKLNFELRQKTKQLTESKNEVTELRMYVDAMQAALDVTSARLRNNDRPELLISHKSFNRKNGSSKSMGAIEEEGDSRRSSSASTAAGSRSTVSTLEDSKKSNSFNWKEGVSHLTLAKHRFTDWNKQSKQLEEQKAQLKKQQEEKRKAAATTTTDQKKTRIDPKVKARAAAKAKAIKKIDEGPGWNIFAWGASLMQKRMNQRRHSI